MTLTPRVAQDLQKLLGNLPFSSVSIRGSFLREPSHDYIFLPTRRSGERLLHRL